MGGVIIIINGVSSAKLSTIGMVLHAYDIIFYLGSWSTISYLGFAAPKYVFLFCSALALLALVTWIAWQIDGTRVARRNAFACAALAAVLAVTAGTMKPDRWHTQYYWAALYVSSFYSSWVETAEALWRGQIIKAAKAARGPAFETPDCRMAQKPPHIILIHQESLVQPELFPTLAYDRDLDRLFASGDGQVHKLRVETYGGASWLTEFSILTGVSTYSFGGMRSFVQSLLAGKVRDSLTEALAQCGYRNVLFYPMLKNFVSNTRFFNSIGLKEVFDQKAQKAPTSRERDRFYYRNALDEMERHITSSSQPLFTYIQTMSVHWPYDFPFAPEMKVKGGAPGTDEEMSEYLRRVAISRIDYEEFKQELRRRFPDEPILIMHYGDHQPTATRKLVKLEEPETDNYTIDGQSIAFITYYAVEWLGTAPPPRPLPKYDVIDVPYLGLILMQQAGLPLPDSYRERERLLALCEGRYNGCGHTQDILAFQRRLIDSNLVDRW